MILRRRFMADSGMGFAGLAAGAMLATDGVARGDHVAGQHHFAPRAKSVIWVFLSGGYSHMETFDPKPALDRYAGMSYADTPYPNPVDSPLHRKRFRSVPAEEINVRDVYPKIFPMQVGFRQRGDCGVAITDWWPHLADCVDDISFVRNMWTTDNDHAAENQIHTGRHRLDEPQPSIGAWAHYGLGSMNENLPRFVVLGGPTRTDTRASIDANYLGPQHAGVPLQLDPQNPLTFGARQAGHSAAQQTDEFRFVNELNRLTAQEFPDDEQLQARIKSYELAYRMQSAVPEAVDMAAETAQTSELYGINEAHSKVAGRRLLAARRMVERGVRFVQLFDQGWDHHGSVFSALPNKCKQVDKPIAALIK
ncbi:MAG: DUF1501 domain-containing protein, partial [Fuerstiella sp.]|nr:DUF1501 domain-containing protein [Fuerstiella sp.]